MYYSQLILSVCVSVCLPDCTNLTAGSLEPLTRCPRLKRLTLTGGVLDTVSMEPLTRCPELEWLSVTAADLPRLREQLPEGLDFEYLNVRGEIPRITHVMPVYANGQRRRQMDEPISLN